MPRHFLPVLLCALVLPCLPAQSATYYVDFEAGDDAALGTEPSAPWKHAPGDAQASGQAATELSPGDTVIFKGGVIYRGSLKVASSGEKDAPITYDGNTSGTFGQGRAILDGGEPVLNWVKCASQEEAGGAANWRDLYRAVVPADVLEFPFTANLFDAEEPCRLARSPNYASAYAVLDMEGYYTTAKPADLGPESTEVATLHGNLPDDFAQAAWVSLWVTGNRVEYKKITSATATGITYEKVSPHKNAGRFALWNHPSLIDEPGEYAVLPEGDQAVILYLPHEGKEPQVSRSVRGTGINLNGHSHLHLKGLVIRRFAGTQSNREGAGILAPRGPSEYEGLLIEDCLVTQNASLTRTAAIALNKANNSQVRNNSVTFNIGNPGIGVYGGHNLVVEKNYLQRNGGTGLRCFGVRDSRLSDNTITEHTGTHANGISVYVGSTNVIVERNNVRRGLFPCTIQASSGITIRENLFDARLQGSTALALYSSPEGQPPPADITVENNTLIAPKGGALRIDLEIPGLKVRKNILDGGGRPGTDSQGNAYTQLAPKAAQDEAEALYPLSYEGVLVNAAAGDFRVVPGSPTDLAGIGCRVAEAAGNEATPDPRSPQ